MTVISTRKIAMARATAVDPCSLCFLSIFIRSRNLAVFLLRTKIPFWNLTTGQTTPPNPNGTSYTSVEIIQHSLLNNLGVTQFSSGESEDARPKIGRPLH